MSEAQRQAFADMREAHLDTNVLFMWHKEYVAYLKDLDSEVRHFDGRFANGGHNRK